LKIWEAIIYALLGGTDELPVSFLGHASILSGAFHFTSLNTGEGHFLKAFILFGVSAGAFFAYRNETIRAVREFLRIAGVIHYGKKSSNSLAYRRSVFLNLITLLIMIIMLPLNLISMRISSLFIVLILFAVNGLLLFLACRKPEYKKSAEQMTVFEMALIGILRSLAVFPGISSVAMSLSASRFCGFDKNYALRTTYVLSALYGVVAFIYYLITAFVVGELSVTVVLFSLLACVITTVIGYFIIQYFRYLVNKNKLRVFAFYCWDASIIILILALINA